MLQLTVISIQFNNLILFKFIYKQTDRRTGSQAVKL